MGNWISLWRFSGWMAVVRAAAVLWVGVGCAGGEAGGGDADAAVAEIASRAMVEVECVAKNSECLKATWTDLGTCEVEPKTGQMCGDSPSVCTGICSDVGTCVGPGPELHCGSPSKRCSLCDGKGHCGVDTAGATCTASPNQGPCFQQAGICDKDGECKLETVAGAACLVDNGPCGAGVCDASGVCARISEGKPCTASPVETCRKPIGICGADAECKVAIDSGADCAVDPGPCGAGKCNTSGSCVRASEGLPCMGPDSVCMTSEGTCNAKGSCVTTADVGAPCKTNNSTCGSGVCNAEAVCAPVGAGKACTTQSKQICRKLNGVCGADGNCLGDVDFGAPCATNLSGCGGFCDAQGACVAISAGKPCASTGTDCPKFCTPQGECLATPGADCTVKYGECAGKAGVCSASGFCLGVDDCAKPSIMTPTGDFAKGLSCIKMVGNIPGMPPANSGTCGENGDPCKPKFCKTLDSDATFACKVGQLNDGTPCPGDATNPCAASTCQAGKCTPAFKPVGSSCKPLAPALCAEFQCSSAGKCEPIPAGVPLAAPCTVSDGDTDCWAKSCDGQGNCTKVPRAKGEHCGIYPDNACANFACDGKGTCLTLLKADKGTCADARCSEPDAKPGSSCTGGLCIQSGCTALGKCSTAYKPVGAPCELFGYPGTCDESHVCVWPAKVMGAIVGSTCYGTFPCMNEDVAYGTDGVCHGTVAAGSACGTLCNPGVCGPDGTCQKAFAPKGLSCGAKYECGSLVCDGKGGCSVDAANVGKACKGDEPWECAKYACNIYGGCSLVPTPGVACAATGPCTKGICNAEGFCGQEPLTGPDCPLSGSNPCELGTCKAGTCQPGAKPGASCVKNSQCQEYVCGPPPFGKCAYKAKVGAPCASKGQCTKGICGTFGQCTQVPNPGAKCEGDAPCTAGTCNAAGKCDAAPKPAGSKCTAVAPGTDWDCYTGECDASSTCKLKINVGASCKKGDGPCTKGVCQSDASCKAVPANVGQPMCNTTCGWPGTCGPAGECVGKGNPGAACYPSCMVNAKCTDTGQCVGTATPGAPCDGPLSAGLCTKRTCDSDAACTAKPLPAGTPCTVGLTETGALSAYPCGSATGSCNGSGKCVPAAVDPDGTPCGVDDGCAMAHVCKAGLCVPVAPKPESTQCIYGCASGHCSAGGCVAQTTLASQTSWACSDGIECTYDFCWGSPLAGPMAQFNDGLYGGTFSPGKCAIRDKSSYRFSTCPNGRQVNSCKDNECPTTPCGYVQGCKFDKYDWIGECVLSYQQPSVVNQVNYMCSDGDPCSTDYCDGAGGCKHGINGALDGKSCGPFKQCQGGKCIPWK